MCAIQTFAMASALQTVCVCIAHDILPKKLSIIHSTKINEQLPPLRPKLCASIPPLSQTHHRTGSNPGPSQLTAAAEDEVQRAPQQLAKMNVGRASAPQHLSSLYPPTATHLATPAVSTSYQYLVVTARMTG